MELMLSEFQTRELLDGEVPFKSKGLDPRGNIVHCANCGKPFDQYCSNENWAWKVGTGSNNRNINLCCSYTCMKNLAEIKAAEKHEKLKTKRKAREDAKNSAKKYEFDHIAYSADLFRYIGKPAIYKMDVKADPGEVVEFFLPGRRKAKRIYGVTCQVIDKGTVQVIDTYPAYKDLHPEHYKLQKEEAKVSDYIITE